MEETTDHHDPSEGTGLSHLDGAVTDDHIAEGSVIRGTPNDLISGEAMDSEGHGHLVSLNDIEQPDPTDAQISELLRERLLAAVTDALEVCPAIRLQQQTNVIVLEAIRDGLENHGIELTFIRPNKENKRGTNERPTSRLPSRDGR